MIECLLSQQNDPPHHHASKPDLMISILKVVSCNKGKSEGYYVNHIKKKGLHIESRQKNVLFFFAFIFWKI